MSAIVPTRHDLGSSRDRHATRRRRAMLSSPSPSPSPSPSSRRRQFRARPKLARLGAYCDAHGRVRELVALAASGGSVLVVDRDARTLRDRLLLAHLGADEPEDNAEIVCRDYLARPQRLAPRPRRLLAADLLTDPLVDVRELCGSGEQSAVELNGQAYRICQVPGLDGGPELRWSRCDSAAASTAGTVSLRELVGAFERYEPMRWLTAAAIRAHRHDRAVSARHLQGEYRWLCMSPVVLNRALREAVLHATARGDLTMSEIALRCGIVKHDRHGERTGESSWVARRVGLMPEGGVTRITPWVHSDVLALIAREGLRLSPREVEVP